MNPFGLPDHQLAAFARPVLDYLPAGYDTEDAVQAEMDDIGSLAALALPDVVAARIGRLGVDVSTGNMTERLLDASDGSTVISGLRYRNLDPAFPFVAVKTTARVNDAESADTLAAQVAEAYHGVGVRGFTFWEQPGLDLSVAERWATVMAGSLCVAARADERDLTGALTVSWPEAADQGLLMTLRDDHGFAGLVAATISPIFGRRAVCMLDVFLTERLRGRGLAPAVQSTFLTGQRSGADTVWGHIHAGNLPSQRTAQKLGRRPVQQEYFVSLSAN